GSPVTRARGDPTGVDSSSDVEVRVRDELPSLLALGEDREPRCWSSRLLHAADRHDRRDVIADDDHLAGTGHPHLAQLIRLDLGRVVVPLPGRCCPEGYDLRRLI